MNAAQVVFVWTCAVLSLAGCSSDNGSAPAKPNMKGTELYSWVQGDQWCFSLLRGTNRLKAVDEIRDPGMTLVGLDELEAALAKLPPGEWVVVANHHVPQATVALPESMRERIGLACESHGLKWLGGG